MSSQLWDEFLTTWPRERLREMALAEYTSTKSSSTFTYWLEAKTVDLGSIWGGSAFKFGIYKRGKQTDEADSAGRKYTSEYAWYAKYGSDPETAFNSVRELIVRIAGAAYESQFDRVESIEFSPAIKWKLAFLYQNRAAPQLVPVYKKENLKAFVTLNNVTPGQTQAELYAQVRKIRPDFDVLGVGKELWEASEKVVASQGFTVQHAEDYLMNRYGYLREPTDKLAAFESESGKQLALSRTGKSVRLFLQPPLPVMQGLGESTMYEPDSPRSSNLTAQAKLLAVGNPAVRVTVPALKTLEALCDLYDKENEESALDAVVPEAVTTKMTIPLNVILYGPPGTGKTHATVAKALQAIAPEYLAANRADRVALNARFRELQDLGRIRFVTFHQSFSYEDFVEGIRANSEEKGQIRYDVEDGVFKTLCVSARAKVTKSVETITDVEGRTIWKMSLGNTKGDDSYVYQDCIDKGIILLGYGTALDYSLCKRRDDVLQKQRTAAGDVSIRDYSVTSVYTFVCVMKPGDLVVISDGNKKFRAIGEIKGGYEFVARDDEYTQCRKVEWLRVYSPSLPEARLMNNSFSQMTLYELRSPSIDTKKLASLLNTRVHGGEQSTNQLRAGDAVGSGYVIQEVTPELIYLKKPSERVLPLNWRMLNELVDAVRKGLITPTDIKERKALSKMPDSTLEPFIVHGFENLIAKLVERMVAKPISEASATDMTDTTDAWVLIIDEINRGNISRIFGELITLIEPSRREGMPEMLSVELPYSRDSFSVPKSVHIIGTMNTADRSLAGLDIALRRRFVFEEMAPDEEQLEGIDIDGVSVDELLSIMNRRIEALRDSDHCLGHSYFLPLKEERTLAKLAEIFKTQIIPLLQEYFFDDWERIRWVLNDQQKRPEHQFVSPPVETLAKLFGEDVAAKLEERRWQLNQSAFGLADSYRGILKA